MKPTSYVKISGGPEIAVYDIGGSGPDLLLCHATGLCGPTLGPLATLLLVRFHCVILDSRTHGRSSAPPDGSFHWSGFGSDILAVARALDLRKPVGFGHSCGGASLLLAEEEEPGTFAQLFCYEPVIYPSDDPPPPLPGNKMAEAALHRRETFGSFEEAYSNFAGKEPFAGFSEEALRAYVENGFVPDGAGVRLACDRVHESEIYINGASHDAFRNLARVRCPVELACGTEDPFLGPDTQRMIRERLNGSGQAARLQVFEGFGHFGPLAHPDAVAGWILDTAITG